MKLILASASPRRSELLTSLGFKFLIDPAGVEEEGDRSNPENYVKMLASLKGKAVSERYKSGHVILAADTIVVCAGKVLEKPANTDEARQMLLSLSGKEHEVMTGVWLEKAAENQECYFLTKTKVCFRELPTDLLEAYLASGDSLDKAGGYGIQSGALCFVNSIEGCYANVVGLPLSATDQNLRKFLNQDYQLLKN